MTRTRVFLSYAHDDDRWRRRLASHLGVLAQENLIDLLDDTRIGPGQAWFDEIHAQMSQARVAVLLISAPFLTSDFIRNTEVPLLFERHEHDGMVIYPLLVRQCAWREVPWLARLQLRPHGAKALAALRTAQVDHAMADVATEIAGIARNAHIVDDPPAGAASRPASEAPSNGSRPPESYKDRARQQQEPRKDNINVSSQQTADHLERKDDLILGVIIPDRQYYAITLTADTDGRAIKTTFSHWIGWTDGEPRLEIRQASLVKPEIMARNWTALQMPCVVVNTDEQFAVFYALLGGNALIEKCVAERRFPEALAPNVCAHGPAGELLDVDTTSGDALQLSPPPPLRMQVFKRDHYRCKVCGSRPSAQDELALHVDHIRQPASGGITEDWNLITLCSTCRQGRDPQEEPGLWNLIGVPTTVTLEQYNRDYFEGVARYRALRARQMQELQENEATTTRAHQQRPRYQKPQGT